MLAAWSLSMVVVVVPNSDNHGRKVSYDRTSPDKTDYFALKRAYDTTTTLRERQRETRRITAEAKEEALQFLLGQDANHHEKREGNHSMSMHQDAWDRKVDKIWGELAKPHAWKRPLRRKLAILNKAVFEDQVR